MPLPTSVNTTYVANDPVLSADLNAIQACIVAAKHGSIVMQIPAAAGLSVSGWVFSQSVGGASNFWSIPGGPANSDLVFPIELPIGSRIASIAARIQDSVTGASTISMFLHKSVTGGGNLLAGSAQVGATQTSSGAGTVQTLTLAALVEVLATNNTYNVVLRSNGTNWATHRVVGIEVTFDKP